MVVRDIGGHKLTDGQLAVLKSASRTGGIRKGMTAGKFWRNFDQLEVRLLIKRRSAGDYVVTDLGAATIRKITALSAADGAKP